MKKENLLNGLLILAVIGVTAGVTYYLTKPSSDFQVTSTGTSTSTGTGAPVQTWGDTSRQMVDPNNPMALAQEGDRYFGMKQFAQAIDLYQQALKINPKDVDTMNDLGLAYNYTGNSELAVITLNNGIQIDPNYQRIRLSLGFVLMTAGKTKEAREVFQKVIAMDPDTDIGVEAKRLMGRLQE